MTNPQVQNDPIYSLPFTYISGLTLGWGSNTTLTITTGQCRDSNDNIDIVVGSANIEGSTVTSPITINAATTGANALDTGSLAASTFYAVYMIADSRYYKATAGIITLASNSAPLLPQGYDSYRLIGFALTDGSSHFLKFYMPTLTSGNNRTIQYDAPITITVTSSGTSATYAALDLSVAVPATNFAAVQVYAKWDPNAAGDILNFQPTGATGDYIVNTAITTAVQDFIFKMLPLLATSKPEISYKISAGTLTAVTLMSYDFVV